jgi:hypothetical protein
MQDTLSSALRGLAEPRLPPASHARILGVALPTAEGKPLLPALK